MTDYHPYSPGYCVSCHNPGGACTGVKASDIDLTRVVSDKALADIREVAGVTHQSGITVADLIRAEAGIGYGGHFDETSDDEDTILAVAALDDRELNGMYAARYDYTTVLRAAMDAVAWPVSDGADAFYDAHWHRFFRALNAGELGGFVLRLDWEFNDRHGNAEYVERFRAAYPVAPPEGAP